MLHLQGILAIGSHQAWRNLWYSSGAVGLVSAKFLWQT